LRRGHFLKVISYFPEINYLQNYWDNDNVEECLKNVQNALQQYDEIDAFFLEALTEAPPTYEAITAANRWNSRADGKKIIILSIDDTKQLFHWVSTGYFDVNTPYTPFVGDVGVRYLIKTIEGEKMPQHVAIPNIPMVTLTGDVIFGLKTQTCEEWQEYASGPAYKAE
jgi:ribose transport system substrate-binding protein